MILYLTKQTADVYDAPIRDNISDPNMKRVSDSIIAAEQENELLKWGVKLFYFHRMKCLQAVNFASHFTVVLFDVKKSELPKVGNMIANTVLDAFDDDPASKKALMQLFSDSSIVVWDKLKNKSVISSQNYIESVLLTRDSVYEGFCENGKLNDKKLHHYLNFEYPIWMKFLGRKGIGYSGELMREFLNKDV